MKTILHNTVITLLLSTATSPSLLRCQEPEAPSQEQMREDLRDLRRRLEELEDQNARIVEQLGGRAVAQAYSARSLDVGGHVSSLFTYMDGEGGSATGHVVSLLELFLRAQIDDHWSVFATPGFYTYSVALLDDPTTATAGDPTLLSEDTADAQLFLARLLAQWRHGDLLQVQLGFVGSPHGTTNREYFIPARTIGQANLHTRIFLANQLYPQQVVGLRASGKVAVVDGGRIEYDAYFGADDDSPGDGIGGARLAWVFEDTGLGIALNYGRGTREGLTGLDLAQNVPVLQAPFPADWGGTRDYEFVGLDAEWRSGRFVGKTEVYSSRERGYEDQFALSTEWTWFTTERLGLTYRFDYYDRGSDLVVTSTSPTITTGVLDFGHATEHVVGVSYDPNASVRLRLDLHHARLPGTDDQVNYVNLSCSVSF